MHKGFLWRASEAAEVQSYELFIDLLYVGILAIAGDGAAEDPNGEGLLRFTITFVLAWKLWSDVSQALSWILMDDIIRRLSVLFYMTILLGLATNMSDSFDETYRPLIGFYLAGRWYCGIYFWWMGYLMPMVRNSMIANGILCFISGPLWIGSVYVENPRRQAFIWPALALDILGPTVLVSISVAKAPFFSAGFKRWALKTFEFVPGNNIEHKIERTNAFVALVFGYSVVAILYQSSVAFGINAFFGKAVLGLIQSFTFNWLYFEIDTFNLHTHAIRRHFFTGKFHFSLKSRRAGVVK
jgi:low temperature requirement protein LtrA